VGYGCKDNVFIGILQMKISVFLALSADVVFYGKNRGVLHSTKVQDAGFLSLNKDYSASLIVTARSSGADLIPKSVRLFASMRASSWSGFTPQLSR